MSREDRSPELVVAPLVWELEPPPEGEGQEDDPFPPRAGEPAAGFGRLLVAALGDGGVLGASVAGGWTLALACGAGLAPGQLLMAAAVGLEVATVVGVTSLVGWRGTPGMRLAAVAFHDPIPIPRALALWLGWVVCLPVLGVPMLAGTRGQRLVERLAGARVIPSRPRAAA